jgi:hypothetical protein
MKTIRIIGVLLLAAWTTGCLSTFVGRPKPNVAAGNEIVLTAELKTLLNEIPKPKIVIRVPNPRSNVTEAEKFNSYINQIEKVFIQNGYTVRDRALLENLMRSGNADYKGIKDKIDTDLIIDILGLEFDIPNPVKTFFNEATQKEEPFGSPQNYVDCQKAKLECRLTIVDKGQLGGLMTIFASRCDSENLEIYIDGFRQRMAWKNDVNMKMYPALSAPFQTEELKKAYTAVLTNFLIGQLAGKLGARLQQAFDASNGHD